MNIGIKLNRNFVIAYNKMQKKYGPEMAKLNGFADSQLDYTDFIDNFIDEGTVADASIDGNANASNKDIVSLENEMSKPHSKLLAFNKIYYELDKKYGRKTAEDWLESEWVGKFYLHDAYSSTFMPYCFAYDIERLAKEGLYFIDNFNAEPPQHLVTFTDFVGEFVSYTCNRSSGAVGLPSFLIYSYYFWKQDVDNGYVVDGDRYARQEHQRIIYKLNQPYLRGGIQSAFTNFSIFDHEYLIALFGGKTFPDGRPIIAEIDEIIEYEKLFMDVLSDIRSHNVMTFPVMSISLLRKGGKFVDESFAHWAVHHNMKWGDSNFFISEDVTSLSNCCRLISDVKELGYFNSIGGTALEVGSVKVNTINLARIAYETINITDYLMTLKDRVRLCLRTLEVIRHIIKRNVEKGLLPNYSKGLLHMENQYNTVGIIGVYEALQHFGMVKYDELGNAFYTEAGKDFVQKIMSTIHKVIKDFTKDKDYSGNIEQVPGERAASILMQKDKLFYPNEKYELPLYGNQWYPLGVQTTLQEKIEVSALFDKACNGGSICHINLDAPLEDEETAWKLINYIADKGVIYFAFNLRINACKNNHGFYGSKCPICGGDVETTYQRIVGFLTQTKSYSKERKEEFYMRKWFTSEAENKALSEE